MRQITYFDFNCSCCNSMIQMLKIVYFLIGTSSTLNAQYIPKFIGQVDTGRYNRYATGLRLGGMFSPDDSIFAKHNILICYLHLKAPEDTVLHYIRQSLNYDAIIECESVWNDQSKYERFYKHYAQTWRFFCHSCDSVKRRFDKQLIATLQQMELDDQKYRKTIAISELKTYPDLWKQQLLLDSLNVLKLDSIMCQYGYPTPKLVGRELSKVLFFVVQHASLAVQEKYLPQIQAEVKNRCIRLSDVAYLIDRIQMKKKLPQLYGTQFIWNERREKLELYQVQDLKEVDVLRKKVGLNPLAEYMKDNNVEFSK
jgi:hypothetical protein